MGACHYNLSTTTGAAERNAYNFVRLTYGYFSDVGERDTDYDDSSCEVIWEIFAFANSTSTYGKEKRAVSCHRARVVLFHLLLQIHFPFDENSLRLL